MSALELAFTLAVLALLIATLIGLRLPKTHCAASRIRIDADPKQVWKLLTDRSTHPNWRPGIKAVELVAADGNPAWVEICHRNIRVRFAETHRIPESFLVTRLADPGAPLGGQWTYELQDQDGTSVLTITESAIIYHPLLRFFCRFVISYYGAMDIFLISLARHLGDSSEPEHLSIPLASGVGDGQSVPR